MNNVLVLLALFKQGNIKLYLYIYLIVQVLHPTYEIGRMVYSIHYKYISNQIGYQ